MQDAFRRLIEKSMYEKVQNEIVKSQQEKEESLKLEAETKTAQREKEVDDERR